MSTKLPRYVFLGDTTLRLNRESGLNIEDTYWRDGGQWGVDCKWKNGKLLSVSGMERLNNRELIPTTKKVYMKDNEGYV